MSRGIRYGKETSDPDTLSSLARHHPSSGFFGLTDALRDNAGEEASKRGVLTLYLGDIQARFTNTGGPGPTQLFSLELNGVEFMWPGGKPDALKTESEKQGWQNTWIRMFPVVGMPTDGKIQVDGMEYPMPQHGVYRYRPTEILAVPLEKTPSSVAIMAKQDYEYTPGSVIETPKGPAAFPFSYSISTRFSLFPNHLSVVTEVTNNSTKPMPYAFGEHPGFKIFGDATLTVGPKTYELKEVKEASKTGALMLENTDVAIYTTKNRRIIISSAYGHMQAWSPEGQDLFCVEPITAMSLSRYNYKGELAAAPNYEVLGPKQKAAFSMSVVPALV